MYRILIRNTVAGLAAFFIILLLGGWNDAQARRQQVRFANSSKANLELVHVISNSGA